MNQQPIRNIAVSRITRCAVVAIAVIAPVTLSGQPLDERLGLPPMARAAFSSTTQEAIALGEKLFFDKRFSADGSVSCASCHQPEHAFTDGQAKSRGVGDRIGTRNAPSLLNAALLDSQFWDGRQPTLEAQSLEPFVNPNEHGLRDHKALLTIIRRDPAYVRDFEAVFGVSAAAIDKQHVAKALASFERSLSAGNSAFDRYYYGGDKQALSPAAVRGLMLFTGRAQCATCHTIDPLGAAFTDQQFHSLHIGMPRIEGRLAEVTQRAVSMRTAGRSVGEIVLGDEDIAELGRFVVTLEPDDIGKFRTPSLRNVELTGPYMHDGSVTTLTAAVDQEIYYRTAQSGHPLILTPNEKADLIVFLINLTSPNASLSRGN